MSDLGVPPKELKKLIINIGILMENDNREYVIGGFHLKKQNLLGAICLSLAASIWGGMYVVSK